MSKFSALASTDLLSPGQARGFVIDSHHILLTNIDGEFYAIENRCSHEDSPLSLGCLKGDLISCTLHGSRFNVKTGIPIEEPATEAVKTYNLRINNNIVEVELDE